MLSIVTFNLWGKFGPSREERWLYAAESLARIEPDILCLQEVSDPRLLERLERALNQPVIHSDCDSTGLAVLSRLPVKAKGGQAYDCKSPLESYVRKFQWVEFEWGRHSFGVTNTHLSWLAEDEASRRAQALELSAFLETRQGPWIAAGDFNCEAGSAPLAPFRGAHFEDSLKGQPDENKPSWDNRNPFIRSHTHAFPDRRIDLLLLSKEFRKHFKLKDSRIVMTHPNSSGIFPSDHYGVLAIFRTPKR